MGQFKSKKFVFGLLLIFWVPIVVIQMMDKQVPSDVMLTVIIGLFSIGGVYNFVQGFIDRKKQ